MATALNSSRRLPVHAHGPVALFVETLRALVVLRRLVPIVLVCAPMVAAQARFSAHAEAGWVAVLVCALFVVLGPWGWRALVAGARTGLWWRIPAYGVLGGVPAAVGWALPMTLGLGQTFIGAGLNLLVSTALFWVGGWGLARDIELEARWRAERARAEELGRQAEQAQLLALRAHLDPHFLFNTLNAIAEWCREDGAQAERAILQLSALLRQVLEGVQAETWPLARELGVLHDVLELHRIRDPGRFEVVWQVPEPVPELVVPPLVLLPLVENAVKHGPAQGHRGPICLEVERSAAELVVRLRNPGPFTGPRDGGEGLDLVRRRLALVYGEAARFKIAADGETTLAELSLPAIAMEAP